MANHVIDSMCKRRRVSMSTVALLCTLSTNMARSMFVVLEGHFSL